MDKLDSLDRVDLTFVCDGSSENAGRAEALNGNVREQMGCVTPAALLAGNSFFLFRVLQKALSLNLKPMLNASALLWGGVRINVVKRSDEIEAVPIDHLEVPLWIGFGPVELGFEVFGLELLDDGRDIVPALEAKTFLHGMQAGVKIEGPSNWQLAISNWQTLGLSISHGLLG